MLRLCLRSITLLLLTACVMLACVPAAATYAAGSAKLPRNPETPTEVVIIGTRHSGQLEYADHAPARFRALLNRLSPAAVGIETTPTWFAQGLYFEIAYESYGVAVPWAEEKGIEVRPIDWQPQGMEFVNALSWPSIQANPDGAQEVSLDSWDMRELLFADTPEWRDAVNREYAYSTFDPNPWEEAMRRYMLYRNLMIAREIVNLAADYAGQRIVVLIGAAHKPDLALFLAGVPNIVIRHASEWAGVTGEEVLAEERRSDQLAILWYNLASGRVDPGAVDLARMDAILSRLEQDGAGDPEVGFLRARLQMMQGDVQQAVSILRRLAWETEWEDRPFTYPDRSLAQRMHAWNAAELRELTGAEPPELGLGTVLSPVANLTVRQRILFELAQQEMDQGARQRARQELMAEEFNQTQRHQLREMLSLTQ